MEQAVILGDGGMAITVQHMKECNLVLLKEEIKAADYSLPKATRCQRFPLLPAEQEGLRRR